MDFGFALGSAGNSSFTTLVAVGLLVGTADGFLSDDLLAIIVGFFLILVDVTQKKVCYGFKFTLLLTKLTKCFFYEYSRHPKNLKKSIHAYLKKLKLEKTYAYVLLRKFCSKDYF